MTSWQPWSAGVTELRARRSSVRSTVADIAARYTEVSPVQAKEFYDSSMKPAPVKYFRNLAVTNCRPSPPEATQ